MIEDIIAIASEAYGDRLVELYYSSPRENHGDGLAKFISTELRSVVCESHQPKRQLLEAVHAMEKAQMQLSLVVNALARTLAMTEEMEDV